MSTVTGLGVDDEAFLVSSLIDRCPRVMMLRELFQNALEAAALAEGPKRVTLGVTLVDGVPKLRIRNTGPGMDAAALHRMCDLASSINKVKGLDRNFGMGAKVASLPSNHHGVRYRSCTQGRVHEVILGKRDGVYGRVLRRPPEAPAGADVALVDIAEVTALARAEGENTTEDWTEVVLLGMTPDQDTVQDPYASNPVAKPHWLPEALYQRYFDLPSEVEVTIEPELHWAEGPQPFLPLRQRAAQSFAAYEAVPCGGGITLHFLHDPRHPQRPWENLSSDGALQRADSLVALVWRNEMYDVLTGSPWLYEAPNFGLTFGGRHISVLIELEEGYPVLPDAYRGYLQALAGSQAQLACRDFTALVRANRPGWVLEICENQVGGDFAGLPLPAEMSALAVALRLVPPAPEAPPAAADAAEEGAPAAPEGPPPSLFTALREACGVEPVLLRDPVDVRGRWLEERAAMFYPETKLLFINMCYEPFGQFTERLAKLCVGLATPDEIALQAQTVAEALVIRRLTRAVLFGLAKSQKPDNWQAAHIEKSISPEALSTVANDLEDLIPIGLPLLRERLLAMAEQNSAAA